MFIRVETQSAHNVRTKSAEPTNNQRTHIIRPNNAVGHNVHLAKSDQEKFLRSFFQKANGVKRGRAPEKTAFFFLRSFFFCASCVKRKSERMTVDVVMTQRAN